MKNPSYIIIKTVTKASVRRLLCVAFLCVLSACATTKTSVSESAYPKNHDLFDERDKAARLYQNEQFIESLAIYDRLVASVPEDAELWFRKGNVHARIGQPEKAVKAYQAVVLRDVNYFKAWRNMTAIQLRQAANSMTQLMAVLPANHPLYADSLVLTQQVLKLIGVKPKREGLAESPIKGTESDVVETNDAEPIE